MLHEQLEREETDEDDAEREAELVIAWFRILPDEQRRPLPSLVAQQVGADLDVGGEEPDPERNRSRCSSSDGRLTNRALSLRSLDSAVRRFSQEVPAQQRIETDAAACFVHALRTDQHAIARHDQALGVIRGVAATPCRSRVSW